MDQFIVSMLLTCVVIVVAAAGVAIKSYREQKHS